MNYVVSKTIFSSFCFPGQVESSFDNLTEYSTPESLKVSTQCQKIVKNTLEIFPKIHFSKFSYGQVKCSFDDPSKSFFSRGPNYFAQCTKIIRETQLFGKLVSVKMLRGTRKIQFSQTSRQCFTKLPMFFSSMSENDTKLFYFFIKIFSSKSFYECIGNGIDSAAKTCFSKYFSASLTVLKKIIKLSLWPSNMFSGQSR